MTAPRVRLDIDATRDKLGMLGLGHAVDALEGLLAEAVRSELAPMSSSIASSMRNDPAGRSGASGPC